MTIEITDEMVEAASAVLSVDPTLVREALTVALASRPSLDPAWVIDRQQGRRWERQDDGRYLYVGPGASGPPLRLDVIETLYGIRERGPSS